MQAAFFPGERELLLLLKQGDEPAFEKIYNLYSSRLFGSVFKMVKSEQITKEILQDVFLKLWDHRADIDPDRSFQAYLFRIAQNNVYDFFRKAARDRKMQAQLLAAATEHYEHIEELLLRNENTAIFEKAIASLSPQRQQVFRLCKLEGKSYDEVSKQLNISLSTISDHIVKANKVLREYLFNHMDLSVVLVWVLLYYGI